MGIPLLFLNLLHPVAQCVDCSLQVLELLPCDITFAVRAFSACFLIFLNFFAVLRFSWSFAFRGVSPFVALGLIVEFRLSWIFFFVGVSPFVELGFLVVFRLLCRFRRNRSRRVS